MSEYLATFLTLRSLHTALKSPFLESLVERLSLESHCWKSLLKQRSRLKKEEVVTFVEARLSFTHWLETWLAETPDARRLAQYVNLPQSEEYESVTRIVTNFSELAPMLTKHQKRAVNRLDRYLEQRDPASVQMPGQGPPKAEAEEPPPPPPKSPGEESGRSSSSSSSSDLSKATDDAQNNAARVAAVEAERARSLVMMDHIFDHYLICITAHLVILVFVELKQDKEGYRQNVGDIQKLSSHFIRTTLPLFERLLSFNLEFLRDNVFDLNEKQYRRGVENSTQRTIIYKARVLHELLVLVDVYMFPKTLSGHDGGCKSIVPSHVDPTIVLSGGYDRVVRIHNTANRQILAEYHGHRSIISCVKFSVHDDLIVSSSFDHTLRVWIAETAVCKHVLEGHTDAVTSCDLSLDDELIASASMDRSVRLWSAKTGDCLRTYMAHKRWVKVVRFTQDMKHLISGGLDKNIFVWSVGEYEDRPLHAPLVHGDFVLDLDICHPNLIVSTSRDRAISLWDYQGGVLLRQRNGKDFGHPSWACCVVFSQTGQLFATGSYDNFIFVHSTKTLDVVRQLKVHNEGIISLAFSHRRRLVLGTNGGKIQVIDL